jgi:hypothetical protein
MKESHVEKINNLVLFPSSKNYPVESSGAFDPIDDPLEDLLNEFSHVSDGDLPEQSIEETRSLSTADTKPRLGQLDRMVLISNQLKTLEETTKRMSFLIDEIENFLPKTKS